MLYGFILILPFYTAGCGTSSGKGQSETNTDQGTVSPSPYRLTQKLAAPGASIEPLKKDGESSVSSPTPIPAMTPSPTPMPAVRAKISGSVKVKGIYVSAWNMKGKNFERLTKLVQDTDLNAMVIDIKSDSGQVVYPTGIALAKQIGADLSVTLPDLKEKLAGLKDKQIYTIARVVVFKDPVLASGVPDYGLHNKDGSLWKDPKGIAWVDPYNEKAWSYSIDLSKEAAALGFDEIQFDYVRFPDNAGKVDQQVQYYNGGAYPKEEAIQRFLQKAKNELGGTPVSADVFGLTTSSDNDMGIGQRWENISKIVDVISPMTYPSHYAKGTYGVSQPDMRPYAIISGALKGANAKNQAMQASGHSGSVARIRPWYQDFTAKWVKPHLTYSGNEVREQIKAGADNGVEEFLLWNPSGKYTYR